MAKTADGIYNTTVAVPMAFPSLLEARAFEKDGKKKGDPKFGASFLFDLGSDEFKSIQSVIAKVARAKWPGRESLKGLKLPYDKGDTLIERRNLKFKNAGKDLDDRMDFAKGKVLLKASSKFRPNLSVIVNGKILDLEEDTLPVHKAKFYAGAKCFAQFNFVAYDGVDQNPDGVTSYLNLVLTTGKGDHFTTGRSAAETFKGYVGHLTAEDPTEGAEVLDDEIPF